MTMFKWFIGSGIIFLLTFTLTTTTAGNDKGDQVDQVKNLVYKHCPTSVQESKYKAIKMIFQKLPPATAIEATNILEYILPQACLNDYPDWLLDRTINLSVYAYHNENANPEILTYMNELIPSVSLGKLDYKFYAGILKNLMIIGIEKEYVFDLIDTALEQSYGVAGAEALSYYYVISATESKNHRQALTFALNETKIYKGQNDRFYILNQIFGTDEEKTLKMKSGDQEKLKTAHEETWNKFWGKHKNKVKIKTMFSKLEPSLKDNALKAFFNETITTPYEYRSNKDYGTDMHGILSRVAKIPVRDMPYTYADYCSIEPVFGMSALKPGDLVLLSAHTGKKEISTMGIYVDQSEFIYITISKGVAKASLNDPYFKTRFIKGCRVFK